MSRKRKRLAIIKRWLEIEFPTKYRIVMRVAKMPVGYRDCLGTYHGPNGSDHGLIRIKERCSISQQIDVLAHEWAHAIVDPDGNGGMRRNGGHTIWGFYPQFGRIEVALGEALEGVLKAKPNG